MGLEGDCTNGLKPRARLEDVWRDDVNRAGRVLVLRNIEPAWQLGLITGPMGQQTGGSGKSGIRHACAAFSAGCDSTGAGITAVSAATISAAGAELALLAAAAFSL